ncbi:30S ribosomal protein S20 [candidate division BRC1 bacterium HGW-BRC1-1]|nr:MAG: 30S ribosomal protein S20 [candidate division BRC1 bacterium HGW-BRC1-1]
MPNIKSAKKRVKTNARDEVRNRAAKATMRSAIKRTNAAIAADAETKGVLVHDTQSLIGRLSKRGIIHKSKASRLQSRLMKRANKAAEA